MIPVLLKFEYLKYVLLYFYFSTDDRDLYNCINNKSYIIMGNKRLNLVGMLFT